MQARSDTAAVRVIAPARLHLGFLDLNGNLGRRYGSIGLAIDRPCTEVIVARAATTGASGPEAERATRVLEGLRGRLGIAHHHHAEILQAIPAHAGLGSGTQLALALGAALSHLEGRHLGARVLAEQGARGHRSAIGLAAFTDGGFLVDGGKGAGSAPPPLLVRLAFPTDWRVILVLDPAAQGVHGEQETEAFARLPPLPADQTAHVCRLVMMRLLPGLAETDLDAFGSALTEIQQIVGGHFAAAQGGSAWTSTKVARIVAGLAAAGAVGVGQSSWGPTGFAFVASQSEGERLYQSAREEAKALGLQLLIAAGRNAGARLVGSANE